MHGLVCWVSRDPLEGVTRLCREGLQREKFQCSRKSVREPGTLSQRHLSGEREVEKERGEEEALTGCGHRRGGQERAELTRRLTQPRAQSQNSTQKASGVAGGTAISPETQGLVGGMPEDFSPCFKV